MLEDRAYLDDTYEAKLRKLVEDRSDTSYATVETEFRKQCEQVAETMKRETPTDVIQRVAFSNVKSTVTGHQDQ